MAGGVDVEGDGGSVRLAEDAIGEVGDQEGRGAGGKGETLGGESVGPDRKGEVGEALKVCGGEGGGVRKSEEASKEASAEGGPRASGMATGGPRAK